MWKAVGISLVMIASASAQDNVIYQPAPQVNFNPAPQRNAIDAAMDGYDRGLRMRQMQDENALLEQRQQASESQNEQNNRNPTQAQDRQSFCAAASKLNKETLLLLDKETLATVVYVCVN